MNGLDAALLSILHIFIAFMPDEIDMRVMMDCIFFGKHDLSTYPLFIIINLYKVGKYCCVHSAFEQ